MNTTLQLLADKGYASMRNDEIAKLSGVTKTTICRRWRSLSHLVVDAIGGAIYRLVVLHEPITQEQINTIIDALRTPGPGIPSPLRRTELSGH